MLGHGLSPSDATWTVQAAFAGDALEMPEIGVSLALTGIYADVDVPAPTDDGQA